MDKLMEQDCIAQLQAYLLAWFKDNQRKLPWRNDYAPYHVWISEIMGQQTQMERVAEYFTRWIALFPDIEAVALADQQVILKAWEGLGYYSRARNIQKAAQILMNEYGGKIPDNFRELLALPGIGPYTAAAIASIAFNQPQPLLDANVERVFARIFDIDAPLKQKVVRAKLEDTAKQLLTKKSPRNWNQALMEFGALVCTPKNPACFDCGIQKYCQAYSKDTVKERPVPLKKEKKIDIFMACAIIRSGDLYYIQQRLPDDLWGGLWEFPGGQLEGGETPEQAVIREVEEETEWQITEPVHFKTVVHFYTKYRVTLHGYFAELSSENSAPVLHEAQAYAWVNQDQLISYPFPAGHRKLVESL